MKTLLLLFALLTAVAPLGGCALLAAGVTGAVIEHELNQGWCVRHWGDNGCRYYYAHQREYRAHRGAVHHYALHH
jgi:hypothetical protein